MANVEFTKMVDIEVMRLHVLRLVMLDTAAAKLAIDYIGGDELKAKLFEEAYSRVQSEAGVVARVMKAIDDTGNLLKVFINKD